MILQSALLLAGSLTRLKSKQKTDTGNPGMFSGMNKRCQRIFPGFCNVRQPIRNNGYEILQGSSLAESRKKEGKAGWKDALLGLFPYVPESSEENFACLLCCECALLYF